MTARETGRDAVWALALLALMTAVLMERPLTPIDETRYASVAWEMWTRGDFLVPYLNGEPYHHKPPLLFWLIQAGWALHGVNEWSMRLISPVFAAGTMTLTFLLGRRLWPAKPDLARMAPFILLSSLLFAYFASALMFDVILSFFVALGLLGLVRAWQTDGGMGGFALLTLGIGGALYAKGPVALLHLLPLALFAPWWMREQRPRWGRWYAGVLLSVLGGAALILAWAIPAGLAGGETYRNAIFWGQTANRMVESFAHRAPWWFYLSWLPLMLAPWLLWPRWWTALKSDLFAESGFRFSVLGALFCLVSFSLVSGKRVHYLLPEFVLFALIAARALCASRPTRWSLTVPALTLVAIGIGAVVAAGKVALQFGGDVSPLAPRLGGALAVACGLALLLRPPTAPLVDVRRVATAAVIAAAGLLATYEFAMREPYDVSVVGGKLAQFEREGRPVAIEGADHGQWTLVGRLQRPLVKVPEHRVAGWLSAHPEGRVVFIYRKTEEIPTGTRVEYARRYRQGWVAILAAP